MRKYLILFLLTLTSVIFIYDNASAKDLPYKIDIKQPITHIKEVDKKINGILKKEIDILKSETLQKEDFLNENHFKTQLMFDYQIVSHKGISTLMMKELLFTGGANPEIKLYTIHYDDEKELFANDFFTEDYLKDLSEISYKKLSKMQIFEKGLDPIEENFDNFYFDTKGLHIIFDVYQIASRPHGNVEIIIHCNEINHILKANVCG